MLVGTFLIVVACLGLLRFPDVFCRMHAAGKAGTLGVSLLIVAAMIDFAAGTKSGCVAVAGHLLPVPDHAGRDAHPRARRYVSDYPLAERTAVDELRRYLPSRPDQVFNQE